MTAFDPRTSLLLTDLYELNMVEAYLEAGMAGEAVFEFFVRKLPPQRGFYMAAGLDHVIGFLENLKVAPEEIAWLESTGRFHKAMLDYLKKLRFTGRIDAMPEGTVFFPDEPILRVTAPLPEAQILESRIINLLHLSTLVATKAARMVLAVPDKILLLDFGLRRAHGSEAGLHAARAAYIAGFAGSATALAEALYCVPAYGTMAHSFVQAHDDESQAFLNFARSRPNQTVLLVDTYDTEEGARKVVQVARKLKREGIEIRGVRLDSGDLAEHARKVRAILDEGGLASARIFASGGIDEHKMAKFMAEGAPIDGYGIGTSLTTSNDLPALDCAYKLMAYDGLPKRKTSEGKATWPGAKQVRRRYEDGLMAGDVLGLTGERAQGQPLLVQVMRDGRRITEPPNLESIREHARAQLAALPAGVKRLDNPESYEVEVSAQLQALAAEVDRRIAAARG